MKKLITRSKQLLFVLAALVAGASSAWADAISLETPYYYGFEDESATLTDGWSKFFGTDLASNNNECTIVGAAKKTGFYGFRFSSFQARGENAQYLISPELDGTNGVILSFWYKASSANGTETFKVGYSTTDTEVGSFSFGDEVSYNKTDWTEYTNTFPSGTKYIAVYYYANYQYYLYVDDFTFTAPEVFDGPALRVYNGDDNIESGYTYNFGMAVAGTEKKFTLNNPGTADVTVNIAATGGYGVSPVTATIAAGDEATLTLTMSETTGEGTVTITPTAEGLDAFTINVNGTARKEGKIFIDFENNPLPTTWTKENGWSITNGFAHAGYTASYIRSSRIAVDEGGEDLIFKHKGSSQYSSGTLKVYWATTGSDSNADWDEGTSITTTYNEWNQAFVPIPENARFIAIYGTYVDIDDIYGLSEVAAPVLAVTEPASLDFGVISEATAKTLTIANTGNAEMTGISIVSDNAAFTITGAPETLAAGASAEVTITLSAETIGNFSSIITVSATDLTDVSFAVKGTVLPTGLTVIDFNDNKQPNDRWATEGNNMTFSGGAAVFGYNYYGNSAVLTTPKVQMGQYLVVKAKLDYSSTSYYLTVKGSTDNGETYTYTKRFGNDEMTTDYQYFVLNDIPSNVNKLQFVGYYATIDEIQGINYAPELAVTLNGETVASPATYDFGECSTDATVTYNFDNIGDGELSITGVAITGEGADAYSTNFESEVVVPAEFVITRTYNAERNGVAQEAIITVNTTDCDFVINVTGTDRAANAPELAVDVETLDFGKLAANDTKTVTVTNAGTGLMTVNIASDNELFTVSPTILEGIAAGESQTFEVTFNYDNATTYGVLNANITVTPTYEGGTAKEIAATVNAKDPATWTEYFDDADVTSRGWTMDATGWSISNGQAVSTSVEGDKYLTTPYLTVNGPSDELTFDYEAGSGTYYIYYYVSKDGGSWSSYKAIPSTGYFGDGTAESAGTFTITGLEAGTYQFRFKDANFKLDNFEGFKRFVPEHDAEITATNIPTNGYVGMEYTATVTVKEKMNKAEAATATLYIANNAVATEEVTLTANGETEITLSFTPNAPVNYQAAKIEVTYAGGTLNSESKYVTIKDVIVFDETQDNTVTAGNMVAVLLKRKFIAGWNSLCLPFNVTSPTTVFGDDVKAYAFTGYSAQEGLQFSAVNLSNGLDAGTPYLIYIPAAITDDLFFESVTTTANMYPVTKGNVTFQGTYAPIAAGNLPTGSYILTTSAQIAKAGSGASLKAFRAYFTTSGEARMTINFGDHATGIGAITTDGELEVGTMYNLKGQKVQGTQKGLYIINGKKVVIK